MNNYFEKYTSNTIAGSANQYFYIADDDKKIHTGRIFYKLTNGGEFNYSLLFSNVIDSTYMDGAVSHKNLPCDAYFIKKLSLCVTKECENDACDNFVEVTFDGKQSKWVNPGEFFCTDPVLLNAQKGDYLCVEISFSGKMIPYLEEAIIPTFLLENGEWVVSKLMPFPSMIGCDRKPKLRVGFLGDSLTQGIGTKKNTYTHWCALLSETLGEEYSYWNLGIGSGRAEDAATDGAWLYKAKHNDLVAVCYGANDLYWGGFSADYIKKSILEVVKKLKAAGCVVFVQTIPPFDYSPEHAVIWHEVNNWILSDLKEHCDMVFDNAWFLKADEGAPQNTKYGSHPNAEGCEVWAENLYPHLKKLIEETANK